MIEYIRICVDDDEDVARRAYTRALMGYALARPGVSKALGYRGHFGRMGFDEALTELEERRERGASDVFLSTGRPPRLRVDGALAAFAGLDAHGDLDDELRTLHAALAGRSTSATRDLGSADFSVEVHGGRARCNVFAHLEGVGLAVRLLRDDPPTLAELGLPAQVATAGCAARPAARSRKASQQCT